MANNVKKVNELPHYVSDEMMEEIIEKLKGQFAPIETQSNAGITEANAGNFDIDYHDDSNYEHVSVGIENFKYLELFLEGAGTLFIWYDGNILFNQSLIDLHGDIYIDNYPDYYDGFMIHWQGVGTTVNLHWKAFK